MTNQNSTLLVGAPVVRKFILGGNSTFSLMDKESSKHFTYHVKSAKRDRLANWSISNQDKTTYFVSVLTGSNNNDDFAYLGMLKQCADGYFHLSSTRASKIGTDAPSFKLLKSYWQSLEFGCSVPSQVEFYHEGQCCICGRKLTNPESVARGIGPECAGK